MCSSSLVRRAIRGFRLAAITLLACDNSRAARLHVMDKKDDGKMMEKKL
jgi:hypothetical protein